MLIPMGPQQQGDQFLTGKVGLGVRSAFRRLYPLPPPTDDELLACRIAPLLGPATVVLDAGCGSGARFVHGWKARTKFFVGCDITSDVGLNRSVDAVARATLSALPFADASFDVIFSRYVLEHLIEPEHVFREFARVLRPGGKLFVLTPNRNHYVTLISRVTPHRVHELVAQMRGISSDDVFPTVYRANSRRILVQLAERANLRLVEYFTRENFPGYLLWSLPAFLFGVAYERLVNRLSSLSGMRVTILATFERPR